MAHLNNIIAQAKENDNFRQVLSTGEHTQVVIMSIPPGGEIGEEVHEENDQVLVLVEGNGTAIVGDEESDFNTGDLVLVPAGTKHNFVTQGDAPMKIVTTYSPPHHPEDTVHTTKEAADAAEAAE
ncbi:MAG: cupin domain-containing protein [Patescibacteria group bacterium]